MPSARSALGGRAQAGGGPGPARARPRRRRSGGWRAPRWSAGRARPCRPAARSGCSRSAARQASFSAGCSDRCTCSGSAGRPRGTTSTAAARHRPDRVDRGADPHPGRRPQRGDPLGPRRRGAVPEAQLHAGQRPVPAGVQPAGQVAGVQQGQPHPGVGGGLPRAPRPSRSGPRTAGRPGRGAGSGTRRPRSPRPAPSPRTRPGPAPGSESGSSRSATAYIRSRQVQKVPPASWVRPRSARWKAWLCPLAKPGSSTPGSRSARPGAAPGVTAAKRPAATSTATSAARPSGSSAYGAQ